MKKLLFLLLAIILTAPVIAQEYGYDNISNAMDKFGIKAGFNFSNISANPTDNNYQSAFRMPYLGIFSIMNISPSLKFQGELGYSKLGADYKLFQNGKPLSISLGYLSLGALLKAYIIQNSTINAGVGLQYGYLISASHDDLDRLDSYKSSDFDLLVELGYDFNTNLIFELRYLIGITNIANTHDIHFSTTKKNNAIQFHFGWLF